MSLQISLPRSRTTRSGTMVAGWRRVGLLCAVLAAAASGIVAGTYAAAGVGSLQGQQELMTLLRFMATIKMGLALLATALVWWRLDRQAAHWLVVAGIIACALMALGPGIIWSCVNVAIGAAVFHTGFLILLTCAWFDRGSSDETPRHSATT
jgi:uncharacterized membrane protein